MRHSVLKIAVTIAVATAVAVVDILTPASLAIWLLQVVLVWVTSLWSSQRQLPWMTAVCAIGAILGISLAPNSAPLLWVAIGNSLLALSSMAAITYARLRQLAAEETVLILSGLLPICSWCKQIRNGTGRWEPLEVYIRDRSQAEFTHSVCQECADRIYKSLEKPSTQSGRAAITAEAVPVCPTAIAVTATCDPTACGVSVPPAFPDT